MDEEFTGGSEADLVAGLEAADLPPEVDAAPEPKAEPERERTVSEEIATNYDKAISGEDDAKARAEFDRWIRRSADEMLRRNGIDPAERGTHQLSRREVWRRLEAGEKLLNSDPVAGLAWLAKDYGGKLDESTRIEMARRAAAELGYQTPAALSQAQSADYNRLRQMESQLRTHAAEIQRSQAAEQQRAAAQVEAFGRDKPDFAALRPTMAALVQAGEARDLEGAYDLARRVRGMPSSQDAARAADEARRSKVAAAKNAGTPRTTSAPSRAVDPDAPVKSTKAMLEAAWDETVGAGS